MTAPADVDTGWESPPDPDPYPAPEPGPDPTPDPDAPYGRRTDGAPRAKPGRPPKSEGGTRRASKAAPPPRKPTSARKPPPSTPKQPDYRPAVTGLMALPVGLLTGLGVGLRNDALLADAATVAGATPGLADAAQLAALADPRAAALLDWCLAAGPYGALASVVIGVSAQIAVNHGKLKPGVMGTREPGELVAEFIGRSNGAGPDLRAG